MKLALHHPFQAVEDLLLIDGQRFDTFAEAYDHCTFYHLDNHREEDFYDPVEKPTPGGEEFEDDEDDWEIHYRDLDDPQADWEVLAARSRRNDLTVIEDLDALGTRSVDRYDWSDHVGTRLTRDGWIFVEKRARTPARTSHWQ